MIGSNQIQTLKGSSIIGLNVEWLQIYIPNQKHGLSYNLRKEAILSVVGTSTSELFDHDMPLDNHFSFIPSLL